jgi:hypothetical protein
MYADIQYDDRLAGAAGDRASVFRTARSGSADVRRSRYKNSKIAAEPEVLQFVTCNLWQKAILYNVMVYVTSTSGTPGGGVFKPPPPEIPKF